MGKETVEEATEAVEVAVVEEEAVVVPEVEDEVAIEIWSLLLSGTSTNHDPTWTSSKKIFVFMDSSVATKRIPILCQASPEVILYFDLIALDRWLLYIEQSKGKKKKTNLGFLKETRPSFGSNYDDHYDDAIDRAGLGMSSSSSPSATANAAHDQQFAKGKSKYYKKVMFTKSSSSINLSKGI